MTPQNKGKDKCKMISKASNEKCNQPRDGPIEAIEARMKDKDEMSKASNDKPQDPLYIYFC